MSGAAPPESGSVIVARWKNGRSWAVYDETGALICVALYRRGADEVARRLTAREAPAVYPAHDGTRPR